MNSIVPPLAKGGEGVEIIMLPYDKRLRPVSRELRKNMTDAERLLWSRLRRKQFEGHQFYRQKVIGNHIVDFFCPKAKLVIEVDGAQHYSGKGKQKDRIRDHYMESLGLSVLRVSDREVFDNLNGIIEEIWKYL